MYFVVSLSFSNELLCEPLLPSRSVTCHIGIIYICTLDHNKGYSSGQDSMVVLRDRGDYMYV
jgi:hypothetical protein